MRNGCITALKVVTGGTTSQWVGDPRDAYYTKTLVLGAPVIAMCAKFEVRLHDSFSLSLLTFPF